MDRVFGFLFFFACSSRELLPPLCDAADWGRVHSRTPFIGSDLLYNSVLLVAIRLKKVGVVRCQRHQGIDQDYLFAFLRSLIGPIFWPQLQSACCCPNSRWQIAVVIRQRPTSSWQIAVVVHQSRCTIYVLGCHLGLSWALVYTSYFCLVSRNYLTSGCFPWCKLLLLFHSWNFSLCSNSGLVNLCCTVKKISIRGTVC